MKILRRGWMYVIVAVFVISMSGCAEERKADTPAAESQDTEVPAPEALESVAPEAAEDASADPKDAAEAAKPEGDPGVRDDIPVKGSK